MTKKNLLLITISIAIAIFFYPTTSISNSTGSPGGKTGSPSDGTSCTGCHYAGTGSGNASITTNIPASGYVPGSTYTITSNINISAINKFGFEITAEENTGFTKTGVFFVTNSAETKAVNNNTAITHKIGGTATVNNMKSWSMDWEAPNTGTGTVTFYAAFIGANGDGTNIGDTYKTANLSINEAIINPINNIYAENNIMFNTDKKIIQSKTPVLVYDMQGRLVLLTNSPTTNISHLKKGVYILNSLERSKKIILN